MHWQSKTTIRRTDRQFSTYIRMRDGRCVYKIKCYGEPRNWKELDCSHYHGRGKESVRFDTDNCDAACKSCHNFVHTADGMIWLDEWKEKQLGKKGFELLLLRANTTKKRDDFIDTLAIKMLSGLL